MNRVRTIGILVALLGIGAIVYSVLDFLGIHLSGESAGIGAFPNLTTNIGVLLLALGIVAAIIGDSRSLK